jgi:hypothetical protein
MAYAKETVATHINVLVGILDEGILDEAAGHKEIVPRGGTLS